VRRPAPRRGPGELSRVAARRLQRQSPPTSAPAPPQGQAAPTAPPTATYQAPAADRFNYVFVMGSGGVFALADHFARAYYQGHAIKQGTSLCGILEAIRGDVEFGTSGDPRRLIGQVVVITHGLADGRVLFPLNDGDKDQWVRPEDVTTILSTDWITRTSLGCRFAARAVAGASDAATWVNVKGCNLGQNPAAVDALRGLFGGQATVTAPKATVRIENLSYGAGVTGRRTAAEAISWMVRNLYLPPDAEAWAPERKEEFVKGLFVANAGPAGIPSDALVLPGGAKVPPSDPRYQENIAVSRPTP